MTTTLKIDGMSCGHCVAAVRGALQRVAGVETVHVDLAAGSATVEHRPETESKALEAAVTEEGYRIKGA